MANKRKIFFRADAGPEIGYGHYIRSLALADMLKQDFDCTMFTQSPTEYQLCEAAPICSVVALPNDDSKFSIFLDYLTGSEIVVLDNYFYTTDYQRAIKAKGCKLVCLFDVPDKRYCADVVISQVLGYCPEGFILEPFTVLCMGLGYSLLRSPFLNLQSSMLSINRSIGSIVVSFGGADKYNLTKKYIGALITKPEITQIDAIIGDSYEGRIDSSTKVRYHRNLNAVEIRDLFLQSEFALLPASTMMREAMACGCRIIGGYYIDNQLQDYNACVNLRYIYGIGDMCLSTTISFFDKLKINKSLFGQVKIPREEFQCIPDKFIALFKKI